MRKQVAYYGIFIALALIAAYVEALIPMPVPVPGIRLGLANVVSTVLLMFFGIREAAFVLVIRILLSGFLFGNLFAILYSLSGGILSLLVMYLLKHTGHFSVMGISVAGGTTHNIGQLLMACLVVQNINLIYYLPVLLLAGIITGLLTGLIDHEIIKRISKRGKNL